MQNAVLKTLKFEYFPIFDYHKEKSIKQQTRMKQKIKVKET